MVRRELELNGANRMMLPPLHPWGMLVVRPADEEGPPPKLRPGWSDLYRSEVVELDIDGAPAFVVKPRKERSDGKQPWVWYAPSLRADDGQWTLPTERHAKVVSTLLDQGFYFCGVHVGESYGSPAGRETFTKFYARVVQQFGLSKKACLFPVSRGGLMHYNWAAEHPQCVQCIGAIYPVCDVTDRPGLEKASKAYGIPVEQLAAELDKHNPIERLAPLAAARVPILHLHGDSDNVVPLNRHSAELARRYKRLGGRIELKVVAGKGHEFAPEFWENPQLAEFFLQQVR
jgi:dipeptidyl aminopeptidase/acylaminoacyl peptidase